MVVLTYKLVLQYVFNHFVMSSFKYEIKASQKSQVSYHYLYLGTFVDNLCWSLY